MRPGKKAALSEWQAKRLRVIAVLKEVGDTVSNCEVARRASVSEYLVRKFKLKWWKDVKEGINQGKLVVPKDDARQGRPKKFSPRCAFLPCWRSTVSHLCQTQKGNLEPCKKAPILDCRQADSKSS